jgi:hypothetical protein
MKNGIWIDPGLAPSIIYTYNNKQFFGFLSNGLAYYNLIKKSSKLYIFSFDD